MKTSEIAKQYGIDRADFEVFLWAMKAPIKQEGIFGPLDLMGDIPLYVSMFQRYVQTGKLPDVEEERQRVAAEAVTRAAEEAARAEQAAREMAREKMLPEMPAISGCCLDGFRIKKYSETILLEESGYINRNSTNEPEELKNILKAARKKMIRDLRIRAYDLGCNAVIGLHFDYVTLSSETASWGDHVFRPYAICITAEGTAVVAEREE